MFLDVRLLPLTRGVRGRIALTVLMGVAASTVGVARFALLGWLLAELYSGHRLTALWPALLLIAAVMGLRGLLEYARARFAHETSARVQLRLRARLHDQVVALGPAWFGVERTSDALLTLTEGVEQLETYFGQFLPQLFVAALTPLVIFGLMAGFDLPLAAILLAFAWLALLAPAAFARWEAKTSLKRRDAYHRLAAEFLDAVQGLATLKSFGQAAARSRRLASRCHEVYKATLWVLAKNAFTRGIADTMIAIGTATTLVVGAYRVDAGSTSLSTLLMVLMAGVEVFRPQRELRVLLHDGLLGLSAAQGVFRILEPRPSVQWSGTQSLVDTSLAFESVSFAYPSGRGPTHERLSFQVASGERIAVVGASGAGKSTIIKLLLRHYEPDRGIVRVGQRDVRDVDRDALLSQVSVVSQDTFLFHGTIEENVRFGKPDASADELAFALEQANASEFVRRLPEGVSTVIGERGVRLSGGQRQRIAIARAVLKGAPILILDEALSAVDAQNEAGIQQALQRLMRGRTTLIIAHRLSSVIGCDRILVLDRGAVVEEGTHETLMANGTHYPALMAPQLASQKTGDRAVAPKNITAAPASYRAQVAVPSEVDASLDVPSSKDLDAWQVVRKLSRIAEPFAASAIFTLVLGLARVAAFIGVGVASANVVAAVGRGESLDGHLVVLFALAPAAGLFHWLESWLAHDMAFRMLSRMRVALFDKLARLAPAFLLRRRSGDLVALATHDVERTEYFFAHTLAPAVVAVLVPGVVLMVLLSFEWTMAVAIVPFLLFVAAGPLWGRSRIDRLSSQARQASAALAADASDSLQGLHEIIAYQQAGRRRAQFLAAAREHLRLRTLTLKGLAKQDALLEVAVGLGGLTVLIAGAMSEQLDPVLLPVMTLLALSTFLPVSEIAHVGRQLSDTVGAVRRLHAVQSETEAVRDGPGHSETSSDVRASGGKADVVEFRDVAFRYPGQRSMALRGVSFAMPAGSTTALVGRSGAGKTTISQLCLRFFDPTEGALMIMGQDARQFRLDDLRAQFALVGQDTHLFDDTLEANLRIARTNASRTELEDALSQAALLPWVASLPEGLRTRLGERGHRLSGGQRQRIAIARALLKDAPILILDEATSQLDAVSEGVIQRALDGLMASRTTLVIAHRLSTVRDADQIVVIDEGRVVQRGTHRMLLRSDGEYRTLVSSQVRLVGGVAA